jgi:hypothetical protein
VDKHIGRGRIEHPNLVWVDGDHLRLIEEKRREGEETSHLPARFSERKKSRLSASSFVSMPSKWNLKRPV